MKVGILTGGGDAPGLNAVIRASTVAARKEGWDVIGFELGWKGVLEKLYRELTEEDVEGIHRLGGTILYSSRTNLAKIPDGFEKAKKNLEDLEIDALIAAGGEDTLGLAYKLYKMGVNIVGVPKTIDNDVNGTDYTFGFDTAINRVMEALDRLHTTTQAHQRVMVVEIMGRYSGWIALHGGMAGGAHYICVPEEPFDTQEICRMIKERWARGKKYAIIAVAEGAVDPKLKMKIQHSAERDPFGHVQLGTGKGIGAVLAEEIQEDTGIETRHVVLGHLQRGGDPSAFDRVLGTRFGVKVIEMIKKERFGYMSALRGSEIVAVPLEEVVGGNKFVSLDRYEVSKIFFGQ